MQRPSGPSATRKRLLGPPNKALRNCQKHCVGPSAHESWLIDRIWAYNPPMGCDLLLGKHFSIAAFSIPSLWAGSGAHPDPSSGEKSLSFLRGANFHTIELHSSQPVLSSIVSVGFAPGFPGRYGQFVPGKLFPLCKLSPVWRRLLYKNLKAPQNLKYINFVSYPLSSCCMSLMLVEQCFLQRHGSLK